MRIYALVVPSNGVPFAAVKCTCGRHNHVAASESWVNCTSPTCLESEFLEQLYHEFLLEFRPEDTHATHIDDETHFPQSDDT